MGADMQHRLVSSLRNRVRALWRDISGVAAVEFGLLAPLLLLMTFGTIELTRALIIHKRFQRATSMVGDLVTRENQLWPENTTSPDPKNVPANYPAFRDIARGNLNGIMTAAVHAMEPYSVTPLVINVYQVWANPKDLTQSKVEWSYGYNWQTGAETHPECGNAPSFNVDKTVFASGVRAVFVRAQYSYTPILSNLLPAIVHAMTWSDTMVMAPRNVPSVMYLPGLNNGTDWTTMDKSACAS
jgi:Flp pilus assembly pilin Flp